MIEDPEDVKHIAETAAIACAGFAIIYWWVMGSLYPCLRMTLNVDRASSASAQDTLTVSLLIENPGRASLSLEHIKISYSAIAHAKSEKDEHDIVLTRDKIDDERNPHPINLAPSDSTHVGTMFSVSEADAYVVSALVVASIPFLRIPDVRRGMQWRASRAVARIANP